MLSPVPSIAFNGRRVETVHPTLGDVAEIHFDELVNCASRRRAETDLVLIRHKLVLGDLGIASLGEVPLRSEDMKRVPTAICLFRP
jgi:hypothetical protein